MGLSETEIKNFSGHTLKSQILHVLYLQPSLSERMASIHHKFSHVNSQTFSRTRTSSSPPTELFSTEVPKTPLPRYSYHHRVRLDYDL